MSDTRVDSQPCHPAMHSLADWSHTPRTCIVVDTPCGNSARKCGRRLARSTPSSLWNRKSHNHAWAGSAAYSKLRTPAPMPGSSLRLDLPSGIWHILPAAHMSCDSIAHTQDRDPAPSWPLSIPARIQHICASGYGTAGSISHTPGPRPERRRGRPRHARSANMGVSAGGSSSHSTACRRVRCLGSSPRTARTPVARDGSCGSRLRIRHRVLESGRPRLWCGRSQGTGASAGDSSCGRRGRPDRDSAQLRQRS